MKIIGLVGNNADFSYNRLLLQFMAQHFTTDVTIEVQEIKELPLFNESTAQPTPACVVAMAEKIAAADGVVIATPEYDHSIPASLKNCLEWLSYAAHPFTDKPVMVVGASLGQQGTSFAQTQLREILNSPGLNAHVLSGNQFMLGFAKQQFNEAGQLTDDRTLKFLTTCFETFQQFIQAHRLVPAE